MERLRRGPDRAVPRLRRMRDHGNQRMRALRRDADARSASPNRPIPPAGSPSTRSFVVIAVLLVALVGYVFVPEGTLRQATYSAIGALCMAVAFWGYLRNGRRPRPAGWLLVLLGFLGWVAGDLMYLVELTVLHLNSYPAPSDAIYIPAYVLMASGL